jgi:adenylosuccinate synthase
MFSKIQSRSFSKWAPNHTGPCESGLHSKFTVILGSQWGDEGKGKLVDILAKDYDVCARFNGGSNAGHTVVADGKKYAFHLLPCGILYQKCVNVLGNGVVVNLPMLFKELSQLDDAGISYKGRLLISDRAHLVSNV